MLAKLTAKDRSRIIAQLLESFKTDELSLETIDAEVEAVRGLGLLPELVDRTYQIARYCSM